MQNCGITLSPISIQENFPRTENFAKISLLKVENFQLQNFFPTEYVSANHILQNFLCGKFSLVEMGFDRADERVRKILIRIVTSSYSSYLYYKWFSKNIVDSGSIINRRMFYLLTQLSFEYFDIEPNELNIPKYFDTT